MGCSVDKMGVIDINPNSNRPYQKPLYPKQTPGQFSYNNPVPLQNHQHLPPIQPRATPNKPTYYVDLDDGKDHQNKISAKGNFEKVELNEKTIERFLQIQTEIEVYEKKGIFEGLKVLEEDLENTRKAKAQAEINTRVLAEKTKKELQDFDYVRGQSVQAFIRDSQARQKTISKEEQEYLQALNEEEISKNELKALTEKYNELHSKIEAFRKENDKAIQLNLEQAHILSCIFEGTHGSELENQLENDFKTLSESKQSLESAIRKWSNARFLLVYAYNQTKTSEDRWIDVLKSGDDKILLATEVRNNLVAAHQNLINTKSYLKNVEIPYCTEDDLKSLHGLATNVYEDMRTTERQRYALDVIQTVRKRCAALCQWIDQVIRDSLVADYTRTKLDFDSTNKKLKLERVRLMQDAIKQKTGKTVNIKIHDTERNMNPVDLNSIPNQVLNDKSGKLDDIQEKPISIADLPPPPSMDQILGNVEKIKQNYFNQNDEWNRQLEEGKREADEKIKQILAQYKPKDEQ